MSLQSQLALDPQFKQAFEGIKLYGVAGTNGSGKDTIMHLMAEHGFFVFNTGDALRQITKAVMGSTQRGGNDSPTGKIANFQRSLYPGGMVTVGMIDYWTRVLHLPKELQPKGLVIGSIRAVGEAQTLKDFGGKLIVVDANPKVRYDRIISRSRSYEAQISFEQFVKEEEAEMGVGETDPTKFGMAHVIGMADVTINNNGESIEEFSKEAKVILGLE